MRNGAMVAAGALALWGGAAFAASPPPPSASALPLVAIKATAKGQALADAPVEVFLLGPVRGTQSPVGYGTTNAQGQAFLRFVPTPGELSQANSNNGNLSFSVIVLDKGTTPDVVSFTRHIGSVAGAGIAPAFVLAQGGTPHPWSQGSSTFASRDGEPILSASPQETCIYRYEVDGTSASYTTVGELHNARDSTATFTYGQNSDSSIEVGYSVTGDSNWSSDGNITISNSQSASVGLTRNSSQWYDAGYQLKSEFSYERLYYYNVCVGYSPYYQAEATQWDGGILVGNNVSGNDGKPNQYVTQVAAGGKFTRSSNAAWRYSGAVSPGWGVTLSAQSGFSTYVTEHWLMSGFTQDLYGNNNFPTQSQIIYAY